MGQFRQINVTYAIADVVCVAGSFAPIGGHNLLEPAALAKPIIVGPQTFKIPDLVGRMQQVGALVVCDNAQALAEDCYILRSTVMQVLLVLQLLMFMSLVDEFFQTTIRG